MAAAPDPKPARILPESRTLSEEEQMQLREICDLGEELEAAIGRLHVRPNGAAAHQLQCARDRIAEGVFWAVHYLTK